MTDLYFGIKFIGGAVVIGLFVLIFLLSKSTFDILRGKSMSFSFNSQIDKKKYTTQYEGLEHSDIPNCCQDCPNHPSNGGSGICNCTAPYFEQGVTCTNTVQTLNVTK